MDMKYFVHLCTVHAVYTNPKIKCTNELTELDALCIHKILRTIEGSKTICATSLNLCVALSR